MKRHVIVHFLQVLPMIVERKTWDDLWSSLKTTRFEKQVQRMKVNNQHLLVKMLHIVLTEKNYGILTKKLPLGQLNIFAYNSHAGLQLC